MRSQQDSTVAGVALVTGAASGIGRALVEALSNRGLTVHAADIDEAGLAEVADLPGVTTQRLDVSDGDAVRAWIEGAADQGRVDYVFNNAGMLVGGRFEDTTEEQWRAIVDVNLWGVVHGTRAAWDVMRRQGGGGHIVNTSSSAGLMPVLDSSAYATTKHAVVGLSTSIRAEGKRHGIKVSVVIPGVVATGIWASAQNAGDYDYVKAMKRVPFKQISPADAATAVIEGVERNDAHIVFPGYNKVLTRFYRTFPTVAAKIVVR